MRLATPKELRAVRALAHGAPVLVAMGDGSDQPGSYQGGYDRSVFVRFEGHGGRNSCMPRDAVRPAESTQQHPSEEAA